MSKDFDGQTITQCFEVVSKCGKELDAMCDAISEQLSKALSDSDVRWIGDAEEDARFAGAGWVYSDYMWWLPIGPKKNSTKKMYFGYQVSLIGDGIAIPGIPEREPVIHVFLWSDPPSFEKECYMFFPFEVDQGLFKIDNGLLEWVEDVGYQWSGRASSWTFSVRLFTLNSREDIKKYVIEPALALLNGEKTSLSLPADIPGLVRYSNEILGLNSVPVQKE